jgi:hypothetical protein
VKSSRKLKGDWRSGEERKEEAGKKKKKQEEREEIEERQLKNCLFIKAVNNNTKLGLNRQ